MTCGEKVVRLDEIYMCTDYMCTDVYRCDRLHTPNKPLKCDQNQAMYVDFIRHFLSLNSRHNSSPRHGQTVRDIKNPSAI